MKYGIVLALLLVATTALAQHGPEALRPPRTYTTAPVGVAEAQAWRADLRQLMSDIERIHPRPFYNTARATFDSAVALLHDRIPELAAHEIIVELERIVALVGDGHTNINLVSAAGVDFHQLPIRFGLYADGIYIEAADAAYAEAVGGRVVAFGKIPADSALLRLLPIISRDNAQWVQVAAPQLLNLMEVLHALRLSDRLDRATITIAKNGATRTLALTPLAQTRPRAFGYTFMPRLTRDWVEARDQASLPLPLYQRRNDELYWWEHLPEERLLYIKWDQMQNRRNGESALQVIRAGLAYARANAGNVDKVLLDIRNNTGGEGGLTDAVVREIIRTREFDEPGKFFVAIGPRTFSAGLLFAASLERFARPLFVGEPTGGKPVVAAGHEFSVLTNSGIGVSISPLIYQAGLLPHDARQFIAPRLYVRPTFDDYVANRDPVIAAVLAYKPNELISQVRPLIERGDTVAAEERVRRYGAEPINRFNGAAPQVNTLGYEYLNSGNVARALLTFRLNVRVHPDYTNGWDSLGEAYERAGMRAEAIAAFEEVLKREPSNARAREFIHRLRSQ